MKPRLSLFGFSRVPLSVPPCVKNPVGAGRFRWTCRGLTGAATTISPVRSSWPKCGNHHRCQHNPSEKCRRVRDQRAPGGCLLLCQLLQVRRRLPRIRGGRHSLNTRNDVSTDSGQLQLQSHLPIHLSCVVHAANDIGKPLTDKEDLTSAKRVELVRSRDRDQGRTHRTWHQGE
jgi:hypothetical protein